MSEKTVDHFMLERLRRWGVRRIYGYPGDGINGFLGAFHHVGDDLEFVQVRHEEDLRRPLSGVDDQDY
jgi:pyruvate dehydrogenase (quinone)